MKRFLTLMLIVMLLTVGCSREEEIIPEEQSVEEVKELTLEEVLSAKPLAGYKKTSDYDFSVDMDFGTGKISLSGNMEFETVSDRERTQINLSPVICLADGEQELKTTMYVTDKKLYFTSGDKWYMTELKTIKDIFPDIDAFLLSHAVLSRTERGYIAEASVQFKDFTDYYYDTIKGLFGSISEDDSEDASLEDVMLELSFLDGRFICTKEVSEDGILLTQTFNIGRLETEHFLISNVLLTDDYAPYDDTVSIPKAVVDTAHVFDGKLSDLSKDFPSFSE